MPHISVHTGETVELSFKLGPDVPVDLATGRTDLGAVVNYLSHEFTTSTRISVGIEHGATVARVTVMLTDRVPTEAVRATELRVSETLEQPRQCFYCDSERD